MTDLDESLLTAAKLREQIHGDLDGGTPLHRSVGRTPDEFSHTMFTVESMVSDHDDLGAFADTDLGGSLLETFGSEQAADALQENNPELLSYLVGITEQDLDAGHFSYVMELLERVENNDAPLFLVGFGLPNTGKTGHILHDWLRTWERLYPDGVIITNASLPAADYTVTSLDQIVTYCLDNPDERKFLFVDEGSTHFDARTNSHEIASQFSPFSKRFAKLSVDFATIGHTVKDVHPELKRQATTFFEKTSKKRVQFFDDYVEDQLIEPVFPDPVGGLEKPTLDYDPDDWSPLKWDLNPDKLVSPIT